MKPVHLTTGMASGSREGGLQESGTFNLAATTQFRGYSGLTSQRFPGKRRAILHACDRAASLRAVEDFVHAGMFVRHVTGTYGPLTREAIANEALTYARLSPARKEVRPIDVAAIMAHIDELVREKYAA
ncbi:hypothetical protein [Lysobacter silvisoli]|uniref:hypothetical protein n=1 Tax=Lysobacter silvisoli TaxID=2293254 RepID=UPI0011C04109|nr:hypothetical protein [Lysobacter silvisoli]